MAKMNCEKGFTLAEVLITLAIIGTVAALTIPAVVRNYQKQQTIVKLKKAYSTLTQAYNNSQAENGMYQTWDKAINIGAEEYFNKYWKPYFKVAKVCTTYQNCGYEHSTPYLYLNGERLALYAVQPTSRTTFYNQDGVLYTFFVYTGDVVVETAANNNIFVDINGSKKPNMVGRDLFYFVRTDKGIYPYGYNESASAIKTKCSKDNLGNCCAAKIARDGWEIKDDYPW